MAFSGFKESQFFRCTVCGAVLAGVVALATHTGGHKQGLGVARPEPVTWQHPDDSPERHPDTGRPMHLIFTNVVSGVTSHAVTMTYLGLEGWQSPRDPFTFVTLSAPLEHNSQSLVLRGLPCRACGQPVQSWDNGRTTYCPRCFVSYPEKSDGPGGMRICSV